MLGKFSELPGRRIGAHLQNEQCIIIKRKISLNGCQIIAPYLKPGSNRVLPIPQVWGILFCTII